MNFTLKVWRQKSNKEKGAFYFYDLKDISENMSFLEMLDELNRTILKDDPVSFDFDCREGICGMCSLVVNKKPHGGFKGRTTCQLYMRQFDNNSEISIEPFFNETFTSANSGLTNRLSSVVTFFHNSETNFREILLTARPNGPLLLNKLQPADFRTNVFVTITRNLFRSYPASYTTENPGHLE